MAQVVLEKRYKTCLGQKGREVITLEVNARPALRLQRQPACRPIL